MERKLFVDKSILNVYTPNVLLTNDSTVAT
jgi:hypothetical protein